MNKFLIVLLILISLTSCKQEVKKNKLTGSVFSTSYSVIYDRNLLIYFVDIFSPLTQQDRRSPSLFMLFALQVQPGATVVQRP